MIETAVQCIDGTQEAIAAAVHRKTHPVSRPALCVLSGRQMFFMRFVQLVKCDRTYQTH